MNIFEVLRESHDKQRTLCKLLTETEGDSEGRQKLWPKLREELEAHAFAEEKAFYANLLEHDLTIEKARHSVAEHKEIDDCIEALEEMEYSNPGWLPKMKELAHLVIHHLDEEEHEVFQMAGKALTEQEKTGLVSLYRETLAEQKDAA